MSLFDLLNGVVSDGISVVSDAEVIMRYSGFITQTRLVTCKQAVQRAKSDSLIYI